ncbi:MAG: AAA family ATPase [Candidatus Atribacteria bacterium]|nr:AAA family ATPase [Candidatus Atribacteria bacterium]
MIIEKISIHNFGPFKGKHEIEFDQQNNGVHIIRGGNGQGKTSLQRAVLWALYGKVMDRRGQLIRPTSLLNINALEDDIYDFSVTIFFNHERENWSIFRRMSSKTHDDSKYQENMTLNVIRNGQIISKSESQQAIERLLPYHVSRFFFFDGEMLRDYEALLEQDQNSTRLLKDSIEYVLGVPYLKIAKDDLSVISKQFEKERTKLIRRIGNSDLNEIAENLQSVIADIEEKEKIIASLKEQKHQLETEILAKKREQANLSEVQELAQSRLNIEKQIANLDINKNKILADMQIKVSNLYKTLLAPMAENVASQLAVKSKAAFEKYNRKHSLEEEISRIKKNIANQKCSLCGTILDKNKLNMLERDLEEAKNRLDLLGEIPEPPMDLEFYKNKLQRMISEATDREEFVGINKNINNIDYKIASLSNQLADIENKLKGIDSDLPQKLERDIENYNRELGRIVGLEETSNQDLAELIKIKGEWERTMASIPQSEIDELTKKIHEIYSIIQLFEEAISEYRDARRSDIEEIASEIFKKIRSKDEFDHLEINDQYGLSIITQKGNKLNRSEWRSSGEEQLVALALIGALNRSAQIKAPIFMDTPFGRFDMKHGERVLRYLPNLAQQIVLLVTDREFRKGDEDFLEGKIRDDFTVEYKGEEVGSIIRTTSIEEV